MTGEAELRTQPRARARAVAPGDGPAALVTPAAQGWDHPKLHRPRCLLWGTACKLTHCNLSSGLSLSGTSHFFVRFSPAEKQLIFYAPLL